MSISSFRTLLPHSLIPNAFQNLFLMGVKGIGIHASVSETPGVATKNPSETSYPGSILKLRSQLDLMTMVDPSRLALVYLRSNEDLSITCSICRLIYSAVFLVSAKPELCVTV